MKAFCWFLLFTLSLSLVDLHAQLIETDYLEALSKAKDQKKGLLYLFINQDESKKFRRNFLNSSSFNKLQSNFVVLEVNCSSSLEANSTELMYCRRLTMTHNQELIFPAVLATNNRFQPIGELHSDFTKSSTESYLKFLNSQK